MIPIIVSAILFSNVLRDRYEYRKDIERRELLYKVSVEDSRNLLEYLVKYVMTEWIIYNTNPSKENYMGKDEQNECIQYIIHKIIQDMTPTIESQISIGYPFSTEEEKIKTISNRAKIVVLDYSIKQNIQDSRNNIIRNISLF